MNLINTIIILYKYCIRYIGENWNIFVLYEPNKTVVFFLKKKIP